MAGTSRGLTQACELFEVGRRLVEQRLRREHPDASDEQIAALVRTWMRDRPMAPNGDYAGADPVAARRP